jgi:hypothetical protein
MLRIRPLFPFDLVCASIFRAGQVARSGRANDIANQYESMQGQRCSMVELSRTLQKLKADNMATFEDGYGKRGWLLTTEGTALAFAYLNQNPG